MKYFEQNGNNTCTYEITIDETRLKELMVKDSGIGRFCN